MKRSQLVLLGVLFALGCALPTRPLQSAAPAPIASFDVAAWDQLLVAHVREGHVDYPALAASNALPLLASQLARVEIGEGTPLADRLAFLINGYNVLAVEGILAGRSPATLLGRARFFLWSRYPFAGERITLWDLEHERIRPLDEPRIHFALVCASASCPRLASEAFRPEQLEQQLERATRGFVNDRSRNRFDLEGGVAHLSAIFDWYEEDFTAGGTSVQQYVARYVEDARVREQLEAEAFEIEFLPYDWSLNGAPPP